MTENAIFKAHRLDIMADLVKIYDQARLNKFILTAVYVLNLLYNTSMQSLKISDML